jgi:hypothetical protein
MDKQKTLWFKGGIIGMVMCVVIFAAYYVSIFLVGGMLSSRFMMLMTLTGHAVFIYVGFMYPELAICGVSGQACGSWTAEQGCLSYHSTYDPICTSIVSRLIFFCLVAILLIIYFGIGALIGRIVEIALKRKAKQ